MLPGTRVEAFEGDRGRARPDRDGRGSTATSSSSASGRSRAPGSPQPGGLLSTTGSSSTSNCRPARPVCSPPVTSRTPHHPFYERRSASSTGPTRCTRGRLPPATCSADRRRIDRLPYFFSDQYDSAWNTPAPPAAGTASCFAATPRAASSSRSGCRRSRRRRHELQRLGRHRPHPASSIRSACAVDDRRLADPDVPLEALAPATRSGPGMSRLEHCTTPASRSGSTRSRANCSRRRVRAADRRLRGDGRDIEPHDLRQGDHRLRSLRRAAPRRRRLRRARPSRVVLHARARRRRPRRRPSAPRVRGQRRPRRLRLLRVHARPRRRHRGTIEQALELWSRLARPNVMIKVPATEAGIPAIEELTARGVNVNVTLLFSVARYEQVIDAYMPGSSDAWPPANRSTRSPRSRRSSSRASTPRPTRCCPRLGAARAGGDRQRPARLRPLPRPLRRRALGRAARRRRAPPATAVGQHRYQGPGLLRRPLRRGADRARRHQHDARGHAARVRRPRRRHPGASARAPARRRSAAPRTRASTSPPSPRSSSAKASARSAPPTASCSTASRASSSGPRRRLAELMTRPEKRARPRPRGSRRGGVAGLKTLPALRALAGDVSTSRSSAELRVIKARRPSISRSSLSACAASGCGTTAELGAAGTWSARPRRARTMPRRRQGGDELPYDMLVLAVGARSEREWQSEGVLTYHDGARSQLPAPAAPSPRGPDRAGWCSSNRPGRAGRCRCMTSRC